MAFFSTGELQPTGQTREPMAELEARKQAIRLPTGADGAYLLHLFVDEPIPSELRQYCVSDDKITADFQAGSGDIAFGGLESTFSDFAPNPNIRADAKITPGTYRATAYRTEYPEELIEDVIEQAIGAEGAKKLEFPGTIIMITVGLVLVLPLLMVMLFQSLPVAALTAGASIAGGVVSFRKYTGTDEFRTLSKRSEDAQRQYPSIVIELDAAP